MGPAGSGKSTYCTAIQEHCATLAKVRRRNVQIGNLDPAAEHFNYDLAFDIRDLITVEDVMEELGLGPNGGLIYCMEYLLENMDWLEDELDNFDDDEYLLLDCPGQIELYTHVPIMKRIVEKVSSWGHEGRIASVFVVDATFVCDSPKFISGSLLSLSAMISLELPHINILSKCDLVDEDKVTDILENESATTLWQKEEYNASVEEQSYLRAIKVSEDTTNQAETESGAESSNTSTSVSFAIAEQKRVKERRKKHNRLTEAICSLLDDYSMVSFIPLNIRDEESLDLVLANIDHTIQYGEDLEVRGAENDD